jgi:dihydropyrimidinase/allantoinase
MSKYDLVITNGRVVLPERGSVKLDIGIKEGKIKGLFDQISSWQAEQMLDATARLVFPGAIDSHFHVGIYRPLSEDAASESAAALTGGVTTIISYFRTGSHYLNKTGPYRTIFAEVLDLSRGNFLTDYAYHLAIMTGEQVNEVETLVEQYGVSSFKYYMFYKNLDLAGTSVRGAEYVMSDAYDYGHLYSLMQKVAEVARKHQNRGRISLSVHCENPELIRLMLAEVQRQGLTGLKAFSAARPPLSEKLAIAEVAVLADATGCPLNLLHLSSRDALEAGLALRKNHPQRDVLLEVTLHHLTLTDEAPCGVLGKVNPPLRTRDDVEFLWRALKQGDVDTVGSDHACLIRSAKGNDLWSALPGFGGTSLLYPIMISEGYYKRGVSLARIAQLVALNPAQRYGLWPRKGTIAIGADADLTLVDMEKEITITPEVLNSAQDFTPFEGLKVKGWPVTTILRGHVVFDRGQVTGKPGVGQFIKRPVALHDQGENGE